MAIIGIYLGTSNFAAAVLCGTVLFLHGNAREYFPMARFGANVSSPRLQYADLRLDFAIP
jgi:hypothetical protein